MDRCTGCGDVIEILLNVLQSINLFVLLQERQDLDARIAAIIQGSEITGVTDSDPNSEVEPEKEVSVVEKAELNDNVGEATDDMYDPANPTSVDGEDDSQKEEPKSEVEEEEEQIIDDDELHNLLGV